MADKNLNEENNNEEQPTFKVADRRKFNIDGSPREGVTIEDSTPKTETVSSNRTATDVSTGSSAAAPSPLQTTPPTDNAVAGFEQNALDEELTDETFDETNIPGAENPASFANFLLSLASQAAAALGLSENPMSGGGRRVDLETSRYWLDVLGMLREKTTGNLHPQEQKLFDSLLSDLRMQYVQMTRAAEAQLKKQAAQKFSGKDILGK